MKEDNKMKDENELIQYYIINKDLNMSVGKIASQVAHVATMIALEQSKPLKLYKFAQWAEWWNLGQKKIILKASQKKLEELVRQRFYYIRDYGLNEIKAGSLTCVGLGVMTRGEAEPYIKRLQLL